MTNNDTHAENMIMNKLTVYVVLGGTYYEGESKNTVRAFTTLWAAETYGKSLVTFPAKSVEDTVWDYYEIVETELN
jgi:hypothetical protein